MSAAVLLALAVATASSGKTPPVAPPVQVWRPSPHGPRVVLAPTDGPGAALRVVFMAGAADDGIEEGLTRLSQYALLHGQDRAPYADLDAALFGAAAELDVDTGVRECGFTLRAPGEGFDALASRVLKQLFGGAVSDEGVDGARQLVRTQVLNDGAEEWMEAFAAAQVLGVDGTGDYKNPIWGDPEVVARIPASSVKRHIARLLTPANAVIVATGRFSVAKLKAAVAKHRGGSERAVKRPDVIDHLPFDRERGSPREVHMQLQPLEVTSARSAALAHVLAAYLHDRLSWKLREREDVSRTIVRASFEEWLDFIGVVVTARPRAPLDLREVMMEEEAAATTKNIDEASFRRALAIARQRLLDTETTPAAYAVALVARIRGVPTVGPEVRAELETLAVNDLAEEARRSLSRSRAIGVVFRFAGEDAP